MPSRTSQRSASSFYLRLIIVRSTARPNFLWVGSPLCLVQVVAEGAMPKSEPKGVRRRRQAHRRKSDVEDNGHEDRASATLVTVLTISSS